MVFWTYTYPANQATNNWTMLSENWSNLRSQWEYSHAASAVLNLAALVMLTRTFSRFFAASSIYKLLNWFSGRADVHF